MPTLNWIGKQQIINHHNEVEYNIIECKENIGEENSGNMLIKGDNLLALKSLLPYYGGEVKTIYIDPPYNTGNTKWVYNDSVNSPVIRKWLNNVVDKEDLSRSDKWLCMMYPRLKLLHKFLREDGVIFISIDDSELHNLKLICNEIFGEKNWIETFIWNTDGNIDNQRKIKNNHEYVLAYAKDVTKFNAPSIIDPNIDRTSKLFNEYIENTIIKNGVKNPSSDILLPAGFPCDFQEGIIKAKTKGFPLISNDIVVKNYKTTNDAILHSGWSSNQLCKDFISSGYKEVIDTKGQKSVFKLKRTGALYVYKKRKNNQSHVLSVIKNMGSTQQMNTFLNKLGLKFDYPKPLGLIKYLLSMNDDPNAIILDSFAGTGTTAHAVTELNQDGGNRKFILIEMSDYVETITALRNKKVMEGYSYKDKKGKLHNVAGLGGGFQYCELSEPLFDELGLLNRAITHNMLAKHLYFIEFGQALSNEVAENTYLGTVEATALYVFTNKDFKKVDFNQIINKGHQEAIIYADRTTLSEDELSKYNIIFKQLPFSVKDK